MNILKRMHWKLNEKNPYYYKIIDNIVFQFWLKEWIGLEALLKKLDTATETLDIYAKLKTI